MEGIGEALQLVQSTAREAAGTEELKSGDPRKLAYHVCRDGSTKIIDVVPSLRSHTVHTVTDLIAFANRSVSFHDPAAKPVVWHDHDGLKLVLNDADRRDVVNLTLKQGRVFSLLKGLVSAEPFKQFALIKLLRRDLRDTLVEDVNLPGDLIAKLSQIKFRDTDEYAGNAQRGRESIDASIVREVVDCPELPDTVVLSVNVYDNADLLGADMKVTVGMSLDTDLNERAFTFSPLPGELETAVYTAQAMIRKLLVDGLPPETPIYQGKV